MKPFAKLTALAICLAAPALAGNPMVGGAAMFENKTIVENAVNSADHTTLVAAVKAADLVDTLNGEGPFTVFAPTNKAFGMISDESLNALLQPAAKDQLTQILTCHVVGAKALSDAILAGLPEARDLTGPGSKALPPRGAVSGLAQSCAPRAWSDGARRASF